MQKIIMPMEESKNFLEVFEMFITSQAAKGVAAITLRNYRYNIKNMQKFFDAEKPFDEVTKRDIEAMIVAMRRAGLAHNTIATYNRMLKTFYNWCNAENLSTLSIATIKEKETVKETYTDEELQRLLKRPERSSDFGEFRCWVIVNFLLNCGCRASTIRNIQNKDVDFSTMQVTFRHNKNGKIQVIPLCSLMANILRELLLAAIHGEYPLGVCFQVNALEDFVTVSGRSCEANIFHTIHAVGSHLLVVEILTFSANSS